MRRSLALLIATALTTVPLVAEAAPKKKPKPKPTLRTVTWDYQGVRGMRAVPATVTLCANGMTC